MAISYDFFQNFNVPSWVLEPVVVFLAMLVVNASVSTLFRYLQNFNVSHSYLLNREFARAFKKPVLTTVRVVAFFWIVAVVMREFGFLGLQGVTTAQDLLVMLLLGWGGVRFVREVENRFLDDAAANRKRSDPTTVVAVGRLARIAVIIFCALAVMQVLGYSVSGILAFGGVGGLVIGLAAKDLLANLFGGLMIYLDKPFIVGDWIRSPDRKLEGTVEYIGWRQTRIRTFERCPLYVPNATFANIAVENPSRMENRRIKEVFGLRYQDSGKMEAILDEISKFLESCSDIAHDRKRAVNFTQFGPSSLDCLLYCFTRTTDRTEFLRVKQKILVRVLDIIHSHEADIAFPTQTLFLSGLEFEESGPSIEKGSQ